MNAVRNMRYIAGLVLVALVWVGAGAARGARAFAEPVVAVPSIPSQTWRVTDYGAAGDGVTLDTESIQTAIAACSAAGGGTVEIPAGRFLTGPITLASDVDLRVDSGAVLLLSDDPSDYTLTDGRYENCISASDCHDIAITGTGTIDGQGATWWARFVQESSAGASAKPLHRPYLIEFDRCKNVLVKDVTLTDSPSFHLVPSRCQDVRIDGVTIRAPKDSPNTDGIDPSGWNFVIENCKIDVGDDCIAIKPSGLIQDGRPSCKNFLIENCTFLHGHGMSIGGQTPGGLDTLTVRDCTFRDTNSGIRMKAARGSGGLVQNLDYENLTMNDVKTPIDISSYYYSLPADPGADAPQAVTSTTPIWRNIMIHNLNAVDADMDISILGLPEMPVTGLTLSNVHIEGARVGRILNGDGIAFVDTCMQCSDGQKLNLDFVGAIVASNDTDSF